MVKSVEKKKEVHFESTLLKQETGGPQLRDAEKRSKARSKFLLREGEDQVESKKENQRDLKFYPGR